MHWIHATLPLVLVLLGIGPIAYGRAAEGNSSPQTIGVVSHVKVLSDNVEDVSSLDAWRASCIKDGMTDEQKGLAVWESVVKFRHQAPPPREFLTDGDCVHDVVKTMNVYGYGMCCCASSNIECLARYAGLRARGRIISAHSVPEVYWDGAWRMLDASLINYFPKPDGSGLASVDEIVAAVTEWYGLHPDYKGNDARLRAFMSAGGWRGGPPLLASCPFYDENGWLPAATHGWYSTMQEYDGSAEGVFEYGYSQGYEVNIQLREGERLTRNWSNKGLHVNQAEGGDCPTVNAIPGRDDMRYSPRYGDIAPGRVGNGILEYDVPLANGAFRYGVLRADNLACTGDDGAIPALHVRDAAAPGVLIIRMPCSYVYLSGSVQLSAVVPQGGAVSVELSDNNGLDWKPVAVISSSGERTLDVTELIRRRYDYRLRLTLSGAGCGLERLRFVHDIQHSQRALPALVAGENRIRFSTGPQYGTIVVEGSVNPALRDRQLVYTDFHPRVESLQDPLLRVVNGQGSITFPIETPGDMRRLRFGCHYRARDVYDGWDMQVSFDGGQTFRTVDRAGGPTPGDCKYITVSAIPPGTRTALVRFSGVERNTTCIFGFRIDADYLEPHGGFHPVQITYTWKEEGASREHTYIAREPEETYVITCGANPIMESIALELASR